MPTDVQACPCEDEAALIANVEHELHMRLVERHQVRRYGPLDPIEVIVQYVQIGLEQLEFLLLFIIRCFILIHTLGMCN